MTAKVLMLAMCCALAACATPRAPAPQNYPSPHYKVGKPYKIKGKWYRPAIDNTYDKVGVASWYGKQFHGRQTANGEIFDMNKMTAAHPTLPMPSLVEVTNLTNGRQLIVRVNDRGPFAQNRIIDLSRAAARRLGFEQAGVTRVRVKFIGPAGIGDKPPRGRARVVAPPPTPAEEPLNRAEIATILQDVDGNDDEPSRQQRDGVLNSPSLAQRPPARDDYLYVIQVAALSSLGNIDHLERQLSPIGLLRVSRLDQPNGEYYYRISMGPFHDMTTAKTALGSVRDAGYPDAALTTIDPFAEE